MDEQNTEKVPTKEEVQEQREQLGTIEVKTDGYTAEKMDQLETAITMGVGFHNPEVKKKAEAASKEALKQRGSTSYLVTQEPDYKKYVGHTVDTFRPTKNMLEVMAIALTFESTRISEWMKEAGLSRVAWYGWVRIPGFKEWWNSNFQTAVKSYENEWLTIGIKKMRLDFRYWESMGEKLFGYIKQLKVEKTGSEDENKLTSELLKLFESVNAERGARPIKIPGEVIELTPEEIKEINESKPN